MSEDKDASTTSGAKVRMALEIIKESFTHPFEDSIIDKKTGKTVKILTQMLKNKMQFSEKQSTAENC